MSNGKNKNKIDHSKTSYKTILSSCINNIATEGSNINGGGCGGCDFTGTSNNSNKHMIYDREENMKLISGLNDVLEYMSNIQKCRSCPLSPVKNNLNGKSFINLNRLFHQDSIKKFSDVTLRIHYTLYKIGRA